jgi:hypothetical protein
VIRRTLFALIVFAAPAAAQQRDTARVIPSAAPAPVRDSLAPPISPRRAFFYSFLAPGYSQSRLGRHKAASGFMLVEGISLAMIRESAADVHEARRFANDTIVLSYTDAAGNSAIAIKEPRFTSKEIKTRQAHVEDWIALLVFNHLIAGADAFVASHLWDVPARIALRRTPNGTAVVASLRVR